MPKFQIPSKARVKMYMYNNRRPFHSVHARTIQRSSFRSLSHVQMHLLIKWQVFRIQWCICQRVGQKKKEKKMKFAYTTNPTHALLFPNISLSLKNLRYTHGIMYSKHNIEKRWEGCHTHCQDISIFERRQMEDDF